MDEWMDGRMNGWIDGQMDGILYCDSEKPPEGEALAVCFYYHQGKEQKKKTE